MGAWDARIGRRYAGRWTYGAAAAMVAVAAVCGEILHVVFGLQRLSPLFLAPVLVTGAWLGARPAIFAALMSFATFNFMVVEPQFHFKLSAEDWLNLVVLLGVALLTGGLAGRLRDQIGRARRQADVQGVLLQASQEMSVIVDEDELLARTCAWLAALSGSPAAVLRDRDFDISSLGPVAPHETDRVVSLLIVAGVQGNVETCRASGWCARPLRIEDKTIAVALWREGRPDGELEKNQMAEVLSDLAAGMIARMRLTVAKADAATAARVEGLRTALLSSLSHDFRTPLSVILASASSLVEYGDKFSGEERRDLLLNIQEEAESLSRFVSNLLSMTRLESGAIVLEPVRTRPLELIHEVIDRIERRRGQRRIVVTDAGLDARVVADPLLFSQALTNILDNALRYSPEHLPVEVSIRNDGAGRVAVTVADHGPGVSAALRERIFDKFFRLSSSREGDGSGLGLSIARGLIEAMDGSIAASGQRGGTGLIITITLPEAKCEVAA